MCTSAIINFQALVLEFIFTEEKKLFLLMPLREFFNQKQGNIFKIFKLNYLFGIFVGLGEFLYIHSLRSHHHNPSKNKFFMLQKNSFITFQTIFHHRLFFVIENIPS